MPSTLQALTKKVLATQPVLKDDYCILERCGLWWHEAPITIYHTCIDEQILIKTASFKHGLTLNVALMKAVQENNHGLIELFTEWGADISFGLVTVNMECTRTYAKS
ncbi:MGF 360-1Lb [African swine fever virus]|uniref:MGF 360-1Lb n=1 Tax=African swine fever virus TaxID=10497 RepID=A0A485PVV8_ASF|nr:hypothetical protein IM014_gp005 [African swine fever virus]QTZ19848.1 MGF 360-1Lb [synthetic construct]QDL88010.1 MGF_360-1L [African swine fever virus]QED21540.1 MGF_360-1L [African swine fever virus]QEY87783.1 MGF_360-1L protein 2 [African swine fever virus]QGV56946.1 MGF 360-1Lb protein [African swine fever virus]